MRYFYLLFFIGISNLFAQNTNCVPPSNLQLSNAGTTSVVLSWQPGANETQWEVLVQPEGSPAPTANSQGMMATSNTFTITGLTPGVDYDYCVRAICSATVGGSNWVCFNNIPSTPLFSDQCIDAITLTANNNLSCTNFIASTLTGATPSSSSTTISNCTGMPGNDVWFKFEATSSTHLIKLFDISANATPLKFAIYNGSCNSLNLVLCSNSAENVYNNYTIGTIYYVRVFSTAAITANVVPSNFKICLQRIGNSVIGTSNLFSVPQLVNDVFLNSGCAQISNVSSSSASNAGFNYNGIGYFNSNSSQFPFQEGIVLSTGNVNNISGPNVTTLSDGSGNWPADAQLTNYLNTVLPSSTYSNASWVQFDFVPNSSNFTFDYIFASEEYGTFQCNFSDSFAFFISPLDENNNPTNWQNLALIPQTQQPISVVTLRNSLFNTSCASVNPQFFHSFYGVGGTNLLAAPINFNGITVPMSFTASVTPNQNYRMKMVIQDRSDSAFDSAVFIRKGIFNGNTETCNNQFTLNAFFDLNNNGTKDVNELPCPLGTFSYTNSGNTTQLYSPAGSSSVLVNNNIPYGFSYQVHPEFAAFLQCNTIYSNISYMPNGNNTYWFPVTVSQAFTDVSINLIPVGVSPRPGFSYTNKIVVKNNGLFATSGSIQFLPDEVVSILTVSTAYQTIANGIQINYSNLLPGETTTYFVTMQVPASTVLGTVLENQANVTSSVTELLTSNNQSELNQTVIGSYDPNDKMESHGKEILISEFTANDYLYYTIRFQNTGTAEAIFVNIYDLLNSKLNAATLQMIDASHAYTLERKGNQLRWNFNNINLVPQSQSEALSQGYIHFKIKPNTGYQVNDIIPNTASIYFDYNDPIITNTFLTKFVQTLHLEEISVNEFVVYPNPATTTIQIKSSRENISSVEIFDINGRLVAKVFDQQTVLNVNIEALQKGVYLMQIKTEEGNTKVIKLIKE